MPDTVVWYYYQVHTNRMMLRTERIQYRGWGEVVRIANDVVEILVLIKVGPRILRYGFIGGDNQLHEFSEQSSLAKDGQYHSYAGHRLWVSPEVERTYYPDNFPVHVTPLADTVKFTAPVESAPPGTSLQKEIEVQLARAGTQVTLTHRITNQGTVATDMSPWALTVMEAGGRAILPLAPRHAMDQKHLLPESLMALWSYTDLADSRWTFGTRYVQLTTEPSPSARFREQMLGIYNPMGWAAYFRNRNLFVKRATVEAAATYPDFGCNFETYTEPGFLELETLAPLRALKPGEAAEHTERWWLYKDVAAGQDEAWIERAVLPLVQQTP